MRKLLFVLLFLGGVMFADHEGIIEDIDQVNKMIVVNGMKIKVLPNTQIKEDSCWLPWDVSKKFSELQIGDIVEIDLIYFENMPTAIKIEIECISNRAY